MENALEARVLNIVDFGTEDGVLTLRAIRKSGMTMSGDIIRAIHSLISRGVLVKRDSYNFSAERPGNSKSKWGEQKNFDRYIHLPKNKMMQELVERRDEHGLRIVILDDVGSCINSKMCSNEAEGLEYFRNTYEGDYSWFFVVV